tara:strand:+ start:977 stop:1192 length:216 start_codon:yes stop_codon:yes gene_type:complete
MKDIKAYIIGFLACACIVLLVGHPLDNHYEERLEILERDTSENHEHILMVLEHCGKSIDDVYFVIENHKHK